jgi:hypothetical protein
MGMYMVVGHAIATARQFWAGDDQSRRLQVEQECRYCGKRVVRRLTPEEARERERAGGSAG